MSNLTKIAILLALFTGCRPAEERPATLFELLPETTTGITFANTLAEDSTFNILNYLYYDDGGGGRCRR